MGSRLVVSKSNLTQLWLGLLLVFWEAVVFTADVVVDGDLCVLDLVVWGGLLAGFLSRDGVSGVFGSWFWSWANLTQLWLGQILVFCVDLHVSRHCCP